MEYLVAAEPAMARPFVERLHQEYGTTRVMMFDGRAWLEELQAHPPAETRADYLAREDAMVSTVSAYFGQWTDSEALSLDLGQEGGRITGSINQHTPNGNVQKMTIEKVITFEDGSFEVSYANGRPPRSGIIAYHMVPVDEATLQAREHFIIFFPSEGEKMLSERTFMLKRVR